MSPSENTKLELAPRSVHGSRSVRRLRRAGRVPGVIYGGGVEPVSFEVDARTLRNTLAHAHAVLDVEVDGTSETVMVKELQRHPVRGEILHADLLRVRMDQPIQTTVTVELVGADDAPGVTAGGVLSHESHQLTVEALPGDIPDSIVVDVSGMDINETLGLDAVTPPPGVTLVDDPETTVIATITPPTAEPVEGEIETETERVGENVAPDADAGASGAAGERQAQGDTGAEAEQATGGDTE
ncbi:MAG TPA: 50S ribosomal protein L25 [Solirubrobacteraceae bacterium]|nr:50S ribosomal protein L25 [Solirubrobacteraceae bacterium]